MKLILLQDVKGQGKKDQVIEVSDGYARNFLLPKKLAVIADAQAMNDIKNKEAAKQHRIEVEKAEARATAEKLAASPVKFASQQGNEGKLFGSITSKDIADELKKSHGVEIDRRKIVMDNPIKTYGTYVFDVKLYPEIVGKVTVVVTD